MVYIAWKGKIQSSHCLTIKQGTDYIQSIPLRWTYLFLSSPYLWCACLCASLELLLSIQILLGKRNIILKQTIKERNQVLKITIPKQWTLTLTTIPMDWILWGEEIFSEILIQDENHGGTGDHCFQKGIQHYREFSRIQNKIISF